MALNVMLTLGILTASADPGTPFVRRDQYLADLYEPNNRRDSNLFDSGTNIFHGLSPRFPEDRFGVGTSLSDGRSILEEYRKLISAGGGLFF